MSTKKTLKDRFEIVANDYIKEFTKKQETELEFWVSDQIGETAIFGDMSFNFDDIRYDIDNNIEKGKIVDWFYFTLDQYFEKDDYEKSLKGKIKKFLEMKQPKFYDKINYKSYLAMFCNYKLNGEKR